MCVRSCFGFTTSCAVFHVGGVLETVRLVRAQFSYSAVNEDELTLESGDIIICDAKEFCQGWLKGRVGAKTGVFPSNFVEDM